MSDQLPLPIAEQRSRSITRRANRISRAASKARRSLPVLQPELIADRGFTPTAGVPATRAECPTERPCPHVRCRYHLALSDADTRAGRPGLSSVPRDERGLTLPVEGHAGDERPGTTLRPIWLRYRGLEVEREVKAFVWRGEDWLELHETQHGAFDYWLARLHVGEAVLVFDDDTAELVARACLETDGRIKLDRDISATMVVLTRVRGVSSCALDLVDKHGKLTNEQTGDAIGRHRTLVAREVRKALGKAVRNAAGMGMSEQELLRGLRELSSTNA